MDLEAATTECEHGEKAMGKVKTGLFYGPLKAWKNCGRCRIVTPRHHSFDHRAVVALLSMGLKRKLVVYQRKRQKI